MKKLLILLITFLPLLINAQVAWWQVEQGGGGVLPIPVYEGNSGIKHVYYSSLRLDLPLVVNENDILIAVVTCGNHSYSWDSDLSGWNLIAKADGLGNSMAAFWKRADGTEDGGDVSIYLESGTYYLYGTVIRISGCKTTGTPIEDIKYGDPSSGGGVYYYSIPAMTSTGGSRLALGIETVDDDGAVSSIENYTKIFEYTDTYGSDAAITGFSYGMESGGVVPSSTLTAYSTDYRKYISFLLIP